MKRTLALVAALVCLAMLSGCGSDAPAHVSPNFARAEVLRKDLDAGGGGGAAAGTPAVEPTGWATITGKITLVGPKPASPQLTIDKDQATCAPGGKAVFATDITVGAGGELANVLLFLGTPLPGDDPKWEHPDYAAAKDATLTDRVFDQKECVFLSRVYALRSTQTVPVKNSDDVGHNANITPPGGAKSDNFTVGAGQTGFYRPGGETAQPFPVTCSIHPWMKAWMISRNNPYFDVSKTDGTFKIANLPAGPGLKLDFRAWHERIGFIPKVTVDGEPVSWNRGKFTLELAPGDTKNLEIAIDASTFKK